jgi:hypothetical protein
MDEDRPTPGERLLGQLHRQWREGTTLTPPHEVDVEAVAKALGVWGDVEFVQEGEDEPARHLHFADEVLTIDLSRELPWRLLDVWEWASVQETRDFWRYFH